MYVYVHTSTNSDKSSASEVMFMISSREKEAWFWFHYFSGDKRHKIKNGDDGRHGMKTSVCKILVQDWKDPYSRLRNMLGKISACHSKNIYCTRVCFFLNTLALVMKMLGQNCVFLPQ